GSMELLVFQKAWDAGGKFVENGAAIVVRGRISVRDEKEPQLVVDGIEPMGAAEAAPPEPSRPSKLWVRLAGNDKRAMRRIELLQEMFPGEDRLIVYFADTGRRLAADCVAHPSLIAE